MAFWRRGVAAVGPLAAAPGAPGEVANWTEGDKDGFGTAATANDGGMLPEQVWDDSPPSGRPGFPPGKGTLSSTPLGWTHAQFVRLAWSIDAGRPVERPAIVACRYARVCD